MAIQQFIPKVEIWKPIPNWPGYDVSSHGRVRSYWKKTKPIGQGYKPGWVINNSPQRFLKSSNTKEGYPYVGLSKNSNRCYRQFIRIHQLVLLAFVGPCPPGMQSCHNDGNPSNNYLYNLRWDTPYNNTVDKRKHGTVIVGEKSPNAKLTETQVIQIRHLACNGVSFRKLGRDFSVHHTTISAIVSRKIWNHI